MEKVYLSQEQKEFIWENLELVERLKKDILKLTWYIEENDLLENYDIEGKENVFPYSIVVEEIDWLVDYITKETFEELKGMIKMNKDKENALKDYLEMIKKSWTWARLTEKETKKFEELLSLERFKLSGSYKQRWSILQNYYAMFLEGCGYKPTGWREPPQQVQENPPF